MMGKEAVSASYEKDPQCRVYSSYQGRVMPDWYDIFETKEKAMAYWWAAAKCEDPFLAFLYKGVDGYQTNSHLKSAEVPDYLKEAVSAYVAELDEASLDAAAEQGRQSREWRP
jgi:hypothetical protein